MVACVWVRFRSGDKDSSTPTPECLHLLSRATQVFREEYILKLDLAREEMQKRCTLLLLLLLIITYYLIIIYCAVSSVLLFCLLLRVKLLTSQKNKQLEDLTLCREER